MVGSPLSQVVDRFVHARSDVRAHWFADAEPALTSLRACGLRVGSVTNGNCDVRRHADVSSFFDFAISAPEAGAAKPSPAPFWHAAAAAGCHPASLVHVGDDATTDLAGALGAGCRAILVCRGSDGGNGRASAEALPPPDATRWRQVADLKQAIDVIEEWRTETSVASPLQVGR